MFYAYHWCVATTKEYMSENLEFELTLDQRHEIDEFLEAYRNRPSNANKQRYGLFAWIEALIAERERAARIDELTKLLGPAKPLIPNTEIKQRIDELQQEANDN